MHEVVAKITQMYQAKGFTVTAMPLGAGASIDFKKDDGGIKKFVGLALGVKANIMVQNDHIVINYTDAEWTGKIVGFVIGWFLCFIPVITAIIGCVNQSGLPKMIGNDIQMIASGGTLQQFGVPQQQYQSAQPSSQNISCKQCGATLAENVQFCAGCGTRVE